MAINVMHTVRGNSKTDSRLDSVENADKKSGELFREIVSSHSECFGVLFALAKKADQIVRTVCRQVSWPKTLGQRTTTKTSINPLRIFAKHYSVSIARQAKITQAQTRSYRTARSGDWKWQVFLEAFLVNFKV